MEAVAELEDPQCELILLRACIGVSKLYCALRTSSPSGFDDAEDIFEDALRRSLEHVVTGWGNGFGEIQFRLASFPIKNGGLGVLSVSDVKNYAFIASFLQSLTTQEKILRKVRLDNLGSRYLEAEKGYEKVVLDMEQVTIAKNDYVPPRKLMRTLPEAYFSKVTSSFGTDYKLEHRQKAVWECIKAPHAQDFLYTLPIEGLGQTMSPKEYRVVLSYRLLIPLFLEDRLCQGCNKVVMDMNGDHAIHCRSDPGVKYRHDMVRDGLLDIFRRAGIAVKKEAAVGLSNEELNVALRPADIMIYSWLNGKHTCLDIIGCSPLVGFNGIGFEKNKALDLMVRKKYDKHDRACQEAGYEFFPFGFTSFGSLCEVVVACMDRVENIAHQHLTCFRSTRFVFHRLGFFIQKGIAAQLVSRLPVNL